MQDTRFKFIGILILAAVCGFVVAPIPNKPKIPFLSEAVLRLGIDLQGGAELRYRVLYEKGALNKKALTQEATEILRRRIEAKKTLLEPKINAQGEDEIIIQLPGADEAVLKDFKSLVEKAGKLELFASAPKEVQERYNDARKANPDAEAPVGYKVWPNNVDRLKRRTEVEYAPWTQEKILLDKTPIIDGSHIVKADPDQQFTLSGASWVTKFELNAEGSKLFDERAYKLYHDKPPGMLAIVLDDTIHSTPTVNAEKFGGQGVITGARDKDDAQNLAIILRSGKLPAPLGSFDPDGVTKRPGHPEAELLVGPTLGEDAIRRGLVASGSTLVLVAVFMLVYYRKAGMIAVATLLLNMVFLLAMMSFGQATLTLPGIAGIVLTVGMAVDANILIYERIREEQAKGKTAAQAYEAGHERAFSSIVDANVTTLVAAIVLFYSGSGPVKGFAVTLSIGIVSTLFSVLFCGKTFLRMMILGGLTEFRMMKLMADPKLDYLKVARACVLGSAILVAGGTFFTAMRGKDNLGIDFRGGSSLSFSMNEEQDINWVRGQIQTKTNPKGEAKYQDAEIQTVADPRTGSRYGVGGRRANSFQLRTAYPNLAEIRADLQEIFKDHLSHEPFGEMTAAEANPNERALGRSDGVGPGWYIYLQGKSDVPAVKEKIKTALSGMVESKTDTKEPAHAATEMGDAPKGLKKLKLEIPKPNSGDASRKAIRDKLKTELAGDLSPDPFLGQGNIGPAVAAQLVNGSIWAMIASWALMIAYVAFRFASWRYGVAAVIALVHDALIAISFTSLAGALIPKSWGLSFEMNQTTMAAILTIIGFSINDTIVIFDRVRENLVLMKKATFAEIINTSVNQTMSRTVLTAFTVWISAIVLYGATMNTGGGIAEFSFPLLIGVIAGTYSTIYIAAPVVLWWYKGQRPQTP